MYSSRRYSRNDGVEQQFRKVRVDWEKRRQGRRERVGICSDRVVVVVRSGKKGRKKKEPRRYHITTTFTLLAC